MTRTQTYLTDDERRGLAERARAKGVSTSHLIREAADRFLGEQSGVDRLARLRMAAGIRLDRDDLPDWSEVRRSWERSGA